jgi:hypothetical protein
MFWEVKMDYRRYYSRGNFTGICRAWIFTLFIACALLISAPGVIAEINVSNDFAYTYNRISGSGKDQSSLTPGYRYLDTLGINGNGDFNGFDYNFNVGAQFTNDRRTDPQTFLLTNLKAGLTNNIHTFNVGDTFEALSQYGLSTSIKGGSYRFGKADSGLPELTLLYGYATPRWDNFEGFGADQIDTLDREVLGGKVSYSFLEQLKVGFSLVSSEDSDRVFATDELYDIMSYTLDWEYNPIPGLTVRGESSFADTKISAYANTPVTSMEGYANKITAIGDGGPSRVTLEYERVAPDFRTIVGSATPDREKAKARWRYKVSKQHTITSGFLWYRNNLDGTATVRSDHYRPEISLLTKGLFGRKYASADISYKLDITEQNKDVTAKSDHIINLNYRDRFGILDSDTNVGFTSYEYKIAPRQRSHEYTFNTSLSARFHRDSYILKPNLRLGGWTSRDELADLSDKIYEYSLGTGIEFPAIKVTSDIKIGQNKLEKEGGSDSLKGFARMNIFYRPDFLSGFKYSMLFLRAIINDYDYDLVDRDFRESSVSSGINIQF